MENENENQSVDQILESAFQEIDNLQEIPDKTPEPFRQSPDESQDEEVQEEGPEERHQRELKELKKKYSKLKDQKYRIEADAQKISDEALRFRNENIALRGYVDNSTHTTMFHYENGVNLEVEQAKEALRRAIEINDIDSQIDANFKLTQLGAKVENLKAWKAQEANKAQQQQQYADQWEQQQQYNPQQQNPYVPQNEIEIPDEAESWLKQNPWFMPDHPDYDEDKAADVLTYTQALDARYTREGRTRKLLSPEYFDDINRYVRHSYGEENRRPQAPFQVRPNNNLVSPVRTSSNSGVRGSGKSGLSEEERDMAKRLGISDEKYEHYKKLDRASQQGREIYRR